MRGGVIAPPLITLISRILNPRKLIKAHFFLLRVGIFIEVPLYPHLSVLDPIFSPPFIKSDSKYALNQ